MRVNEAQFRENLKLHRQAIVTDLGRLIRQQQLEQAGAARRRLNAATPKGAPVEPKAGSPWAYEQGSEAPLTPPMLPGQAKKGQVISQEAEGLDNVAPPRALDWPALGPPSSPTAGCVVPPLPVSPLVLFTHLVLISPLVLFTQLVLVSPLVLFAHLVLVSRVLLLPVPLGHLVLVPLTHHVLARLSHLVLVPLNPPRAKPLHATMLVRLPLFVPASTCAGTLLGLLLLLFVPRSSPASPHSSRRGCSPPAWERPQPC